MIQYVWGLDLKGELPEKTPSGYDYAEIGLVHYSIAFLPLAVKVHKCCYSFITHLVIIVNNITVLKWKCYKFNMNSLFYSIIQN